MSGTGIVSRVDLALAAGETAYVKGLVLPFGLIVNAPLVEQVPASEVPPEIAGL